MKTATTISMGDMTTEAALTGIGIFLALAILASGIGNVIFRGAVRRIVAAIPAALMTDGGAMVLTFGSVALEAGAIALTPSELEAWARRTHFGSGGPMGDFVTHYKDWEEEQQAFDKAVKDAQANAQKAMAEAAKP